MSQVFLSETLALCSTKQNFLHAPAPFLFLPQFSYFAAPLFVYFLSTVTTTLTFLLFSFHHNLHISILHISIVQWGKNRNVVVVVEREKKCGCFLIVPSEVIIRGHHHESWDCFEYPQKSPYLNQSTPKNTCQIFLPQKNPGVENFRPPKNLIPVTWNLEYPARPLDLPQGKFCFWPDISRKAGKRATTFENRTSKIRKEKPRDEFRQSEQLCTQKFMENCHIEMPVIWLQTIVQIIWKGKFSTRFQSWCWI